MWVRTWRETGLAGWLILVQPQGSQGFRIPDPPVTTKSVSGVPATSSGTARIIPVISSQNIRTPLTSHRPTQQSRQVTQTHTAIFLAFLSHLWDPNPGSTPASPVSAQETADSLHTFSGQHFLVYGIVNDIIHLVGLVQGLKIKWKQKLVHKTQVMVFRESILYHTVIHSICTHQVLF